MPHGRSPDKQWIRYSSLGVEVVAAVVGFLLLGLWIDRHFATGPWGTVTCVATGLVGSMYNLVRHALRATRAQDGSEGKPGQGERPRDR